MSASGFTGSEKVTQLYFLNFVLPSLFYTPIAKSASAAPCLQRGASMELSLDSTDKELVLDLLRTLRGTAAAAHAPAAPRAAANDRAGRAKEALADERAARKKAAESARKPGVKARRSS